MDDLPQLELGPFEYWQESGFADRRRKTVLNIKFMLSAMDDFVPPLRKRLSQEERHRIFWNGNQKDLNTGTQADFAQVIGLREPAAVLNLQSHWLRIRKRNRIPLYAVMVVTGLIAIVLAILRFGMDRHMSAGVFFLFLLFVYVVFATVIRVGNAALSKRYADSLAAVLGFYFIIDLMYDKALSTSENRRYLQNRLVSLSRYVLLIGTQFESKAPDSDMWIASHFKKMEQYILEHERLIVAPKADSLAVLRQDFYKLMKILISCQYGDFNPEYTPASAPEKKKTSRLLSGILSFVSLIVPTLILYILYTDPQRIIDMGLKTSSVGLIGLAWMLLTVDAILKLGIIDKVVGMAKAMRDLT
jgi:hypothetical protein